MDEEELIETLEEPQYPVQPSRRDIKKQQNNRNAENNAKALRAASGYLKNSGEPITMAIGHGIDIADKATGGKSTKALGHVMNKANKNPFATPIPGGGRLTQKAINLAGEKGLTDAIGSASGAKSGHPRGKQGVIKPPSSSANKAGSSSSSAKIDDKANLTIKMPLKGIPPIALLLIIPIAFILLLLFVVLFNGESGTSSGSVGNYMYGTTCTMITITDTDCDANGDNCTNKYNGKVEFEEYIAGVVAAKENLINNEEYYKISAINIRSKVLSSVDSDCTVKGNNKFEKYIDINDSPYKNEIKKALEETKGRVLVEDNELVEKTPISVNKISQDTDNYYIEYITSYSTNTTNIAINKNQEYISNFSTKLDEYVNMEYYKNDDEIIISDFITAYLIVEKKYKYEDIINHYYGNEVTVEENKMKLSGIDGFINPTRIIRCTSPFGTRIHPVSGAQSFHSGIDIGIAGGEPIYAVQDGTITQVKKNINSINNCVYGYGNYVVIEHADGYSTLYGHIKYGSIPENIYIGATVIQGEQIGQVGSTGCSTGNHLHYEVKQNGKQIDPADYLDLTDATGTCRR